MDMLTDTRTFIQPGLMVAPPQGEASLRRWSVGEVVSQTGVRSRHVYGHDVTHGGGRTSSSIRNFDPQTMTLWTKSGRRYTLLGLPGHSRLGDHAWKTWCRAAEVVSQIDVTHEYFDEQALFAKRRADMPG